MSTGTPAAHVSSAQGDNTTTTAGADDKSEGVGDAAPMQAAGMPAPAVPENKRGKRGGEMGAPPSFLDKLCDILDDVNLSPHIAWNKEGDGIAIRRVEHFAAQVLPKYYKHSNYQSFVRQLNIYGFHKTRHDDQFVEVEFKHPHFRRGQRHLLSLIRRKSHSSTSPKQQRDDIGFSSEAKYIIDRVTAEMRRLCNRLTGLEAQIWVMNDRYNTLKLESSALWRTVLEDGSDHFRKKAQKAIEAARNTVLTSSELHIFQPKDESPAEAGRPVPLPPVPGPGPLLQPPPPRQVSSSSMASSDIALGRHRSGMADPSPPMAASSVVGRGGGANVCAADELQPGNNLPRASLPAAGPAADRLISDSLLSLATATGSITSPSPSSPFIGVGGHAAAGSGSRSLMPSSPEPWRETSRQEETVSSDHPGFSTIGTSVWGRGEVRGWNSSYAVIAQSADALNAAVAASDILTANSTGDRRRSNSAASRSGHERRDEKDNHGNAVGENLTPDGVDRSDTSSSSNVPKEALGRRSIPAAAGSSASGIVGVAREDAARRSLGSGEGKGTGKRLLDYGKQEIRTSRVESSRRRRPML